MTWMPLSKLDAHRDQGCDLYPYLVGNAEYWWDATCQIKFVPQFFESFLAAYAPRLNAKYGPTDVRILARERFECPYCGAEIGQRCQTLTTKRGTESHSHRIRLVNGLDADDDY